METGNRKILLGCVADDFSGASDAASFLVKSGMKTMLFNGTPGNDDRVRDCSAAVIALKTRSEEPEKAVRETLNAFQWLMQNGAKQFYIKYCSTFDSTPRGNIGPTIDSVLEAYGIQYTVLCPSLPVNHRVVKDGKLIVDGVPLDQSHMKNHPLNPMWDSDLSKLMEPQGKYSCLKLDGKTLRKSVGEIQKFLDQFGKSHSHFYVIPDYETDEDGKRIADVFGNLKLLTGGSGLLEHLGKRFCSQEKTLPSQSFSSKTKGKGLILAGSCSKITLEQIREFIDAGGKAYKIDPLKLVKGELSAADILDFVQRYPQEEVLIYSSDRSDQIKRIQEEAGAEVVSQKLEGLMGETAKNVYQSGYKRIIVAGGETSGAVIHGLGFNGFLIGESIAPGVPVMVPSQQPDLRLVLKSGNFGGKDFFRLALDKTRG
jgi:uncharacterized protein YgbK (DUF1537 family)